MIQHHKSTERFRTRLEWLDSRHVFSFGAHFDRNRMGFGPLRVINEDWIAPLSGFPTHGHREMEILTYVLSGSLQHRDSAGHATEVGPGQVQLMHAGTGIEHSELNVDPSEQAHLLQIWLEPSLVGLPPGHAELALEFEPGQPTVLASRSGEQGGLDLRQDATVSALRLAPGESFRISLDRSRLGWVQVARGQGRLEATGFEAGDAFALADVSGGEVSADSEVELVVFDLPVW